MEDVFCISWAKTLVTLMVRYFMYGIWNPNLRTIGIVPVYKKYWSKSYTISSLLWDGKSISSPHPDGNGRRHGREHSSSHRCSDTSTIFQAVHRSGSSRLSIREVPNASLWFVNGPRFGVACKCIDRDCVKSRYRTLVTRQMASTDFDVSLTGCITSYFQPSPAYITG